MNLSAGISELTTGAVLELIRNQKEAPRKQTYDPEKPLLLGMSKAQAKAVRWIGAICAAIFAAAIAAFHLTAARNLTASLIFDGILGTFVLLGVLLLLAPNQRYLVYRGSITGFSLFNRKRTICAVSEIDGLCSNLNDVLLRRNGKTVVRFPLDGRWDNHVFYKHLEICLADRLTLVSNRTYAIAYFALGTIGILGGILNLFTSAEIWYSILAVLILTIGLAIFLLGLLTLAKCMTLRGEEVTVRRLFHGTETMSVSSIERVTCVRNKEIIMPVYRVAWYRDGKRLLLLRDVTKENVARLKRFPWRSFEQQKER